MSSGRPTSYPRAGTTLPAGLLLAIACVRNGLDGKQPFGSCERRFACIAQQPNPDAWVTCTSDVGTDANSVLDCARQQECGGCPLGTGELACVEKFTYLKTRESSVPF